MDIRAWFYPHRLLRSLNYGTANKGPGTMVAWTLWYPNLDLGLPRVNFVMNAEREQCLLAQRIRGRSHGSPRSRMEVSETLQTMRRMDNEQTCRLVCRWESTVEETGEPPPITPVIGIPGYFQCIHCVGLFPTGPVYCEFCGEGPLCGNCVWLCCRGPWLIYSEEVRWVNNIMGHIDWSNSPTVRQVLDGRFPITYCGMGRNEVLRTMPIHDPGLLDQEWYSIPLPFYPLVDPPDVGLTPEEHYARSLRRNAVYGTGQCRICRARPGEQPRDVRCWNFSTELHTAVRGDRIEDIRCVCCLSCASWVCMGCVTLLGICVL